MRTTIAHVHDKAVCIEQPNLRLKLAAALCKTVLA